MFRIYLLVLCRKSEEEAQREVTPILAQADYEGAKQFYEGISGQTLGTTASILGEGSSVNNMLQNLVLGVGSSKLIGTPEHVAHDLPRLQETGLDAIGMTFRHVEEELADFIDTVLPLLEQMGVRRSRASEDLPLGQVAS